MNAIKAGLLKAFSRIHTDWIIWGLPTVAIPALRYLQDPPESRKRLFIRDFTTYSIGAALYFLVKKPLAAFLAKKMLHPNPATNEAVRQIIPVSAGVVANVAYAGIGAVKVSDWLSEAPQPHNQALRNQQPLSYTPITKGGPYAIFRRP